MQVQEMIDTLSSYAQMGYGESEVMIKTQDPSVGVSSAVFAERVWAGFDWDVGRMFVDPATPLTSKPERYLSVFPVTQQEFGGQKFWGCQKCRMRVVKDDSYCRHCGTRLM